MSITRGDDTDAFTRQWTVVKLSLYSDVDTGVVGGLRPREVVFAQRRNSL